MENLKLNKLASNKLTNKERGKLIGGAAVTCGCGCNYASTGGSSTSDNKAKNAQGGLSSPGSSKMPYIIGPGGKVYGVDGKAV